MLSNKGLERVQRDTEDGSMVALTHGVKKAGDGVTKEIFTEASSDCTDGVMKERVGLFW